MRLVKAKSKPDVQIVRAGRLVQARTVPGPGTVTRVGNSP